MKTRRLLIKYGDAAALYLPPGRPDEGGCCDFASPTCLIHCFELPDRNPLQAQALAVVRAAAAVPLAARMIDDLKHLGRDHLFWFAAGDCPHDQTDKLALVATIIAGAGFWQGGFTRNKRFWRSMLELPRARLAFTMENWGKALNLSREGLVAWPDYHASRTWLIDQREAEYFCGGGFGGGTCGQSFMTDGWGDAFEADCRECRMAERGCWRDAA